MNLNKPLNRGERVVQQRVGFSPDEQMQIAKEEYNPEEIALLTSVIATTRDPKKRAMLEEELQHRKAGASSGINYGQSYVAETPSIQNGDNDKPDPAPAAGASSGINYGQSYLAEEEQALDSWASDDEPPSQESTMGAGEAAAEGFAQGGTFGAADYMRGGLGSVLEMIAPSDKGVAEMMGREAQSVGERAVGGYKDYKKLSELRSEKAAIDQPLAYGGGQLGSMLIPGAGGAKVGKALWKMSKRPKNVKKVLGDITTYDKAAKYAQALKAEKAVKAGTKQSAATKALLDKLDAMHKTNKNVGRWVKGAGGVGLASGGLWGANKAAEMAGTSLEGASLGSVGAGFSVLEKLERKRRAAAMEKKRKRLEEEAKASTK